MLIQFFFLLFPPFLKRFLNFFDYRSCYGPALTNIRLHRGTLTIPPKFRHCLYEHDDVITYRFCVVFEPFEMSTIDDGGVFFFKYILPAYSEDYVMEKKKL